jgi:integrase
MRGHIRKRGNHWAVVIDLRDPVTGKRRRKWHAVRGGLRDAQRERARLVTEIASGGYIEPSKQTFEQYFADWLRDWAPMKAGPKCVETYGHLGRHLIAEIGSQPIAQIRGGDLNRAYRHVVDIGLSMRTARHVHMLARRIFLHALKVGDIKRDPTAEIDAPKAPRKEALALRTEEIAAMLAGLHGIMRTIAVVGLGTGIRRGELCALRWADIDLKVGTLTVKRSYEETRGSGLRLKEPKTAAGRRTISLAPSVVACLQEHRKQQLEHRMRLGQGKPNDDALVFPGDDDRPWKPDLLTDTFSRAMASIGLPHRLHSLRHTHASMLIAAGMDILTISRRLGHTSATMTLGVYGHLIASKDGAAAAAIEAVLKSPT